MYAYSTQYRSPEVLLLYPHHSELGDWKLRRAEYWVNGIHGINSGTQKVSVATVSLQNLSDVPNQLRKLFPISTVEQMKSLSTQMPYDT